MSEIEDLFHALSSSNRKERKFRLTQAISVLKRPAAINYLNRNSLKAWLGASQLIFTWKGVLEVSTYIFREEVHQLHSRKTKQTSSTSPELTDSLLLLLTFTQNGLKC